MAPIEGDLQRRVAGLEAIFLFASALFLLFPDQYPILTATAMLLLVGGWLLCWRFVAFPIRSSPFNGAFLVFSLTILVGILVTADPDLTLPKATGMVLALASWRYISFHINSRQRVWWAFFLFCAVGLGMTALGILSADWRFEIPFVEALFRLLPPQLVELPGTVESGVHTNQLSGTLLFFIALPLAFLLDHKLFERRRTVLFAASLSLLALTGLLLLAQSRSAWMGAAAGVGLLLFTWSFLTVRSRQYRRMLWLALFTGIIVMGVLMVLLWPTLVAALYEDPPDTTPIGTLQTLSFRYEVWRWAVPAIGDFPFTGTGLGTFRRVVSRLYPIYYTTDIAHAHNVFLQVALDVGLLGLVAYLSILFMATMAAYRVVRCRCKLRPLALGLFAGLVAFHIYGLTDTLALGSKPAIALWLLVGLLAASWNTSSEARAAGDTGPA